MKAASLYVMVCFYAVAGVNHFLHPESYYRIMPSWLAWHQELIFLSGICEILFAILLIPVKTRRIAAWCIISLLIAVFPANIQMMLNFIHQNQPGLWLTILRLPIQAVLVWWAYIHSKAVISDNQPLNEMVD